MHSEHPPFAQSVASFKGHFEAESAAHCISRPGSGSGSGSGSPAANSLNPLCPPPPILDSVNLQSICCYSSSSGSALESYHLHVAALVHSIIWNHSFTRFCPYRSTCTCSQSLGTPVVPDTLVLGSLGSLNPGRRPALYLGPRVRPSASPSHTPILQSPRLLLPPPPSCSVLSPHQLASHLVSARRVSSSSLLPSSFLIHRSFALLSNSSLPSICSPASTFAHDRQSDYTILLSAQRNFGPL